MKHRAGILALFFTLLAVLVLGHGASSPARAAGDGDGDACFEQVVAYPCGNCILQGGQLFPVAEVVPCDPATCQVDLYQVAACGVNFSAYYRDFIENVGMENTETGLDVDFLTQANYFIDVILGCADNVVNAGDPQTCTLDPGAVGDNLCGAVATLVCSQMEQRLKRLSVSLEWGEINTDWGVVRVKEECVRTNPNRPSDPECIRKGRYGYRFVRLEYCSEVSATYRYEYGGLFQRPLASNLDLVGAQVGYNLLPYEYFSPRLKRVRLSWNVDRVFVWAPPPQFDLCTDMENAAERLAWRRIKDLGLPMARLAGRLRQKVKALEAYVPEPTGSLTAGYEQETAMAVQQFKDRANIPQRLDKPQYFQTQPMPMDVILGVMELRSLYLLYLQQQIAQGDQNLEYVQFYDSLDEYRDRRDERTWKMQCVRTILGCTTPPANQPGAPGGTPVEVEPPSSLLVHCPGCREVFLLEGYLSHLAQTGRADALGLTLPTQGMLDWPLSFEIVVTQWDRGTPVHVAFQYRDEATGNWVTAVQVALREPSEVVRDEKRPYINIAYFDQFADLEQLRAFVRTAYEEEKEKGGLNDDEGVWRHGLPITACPGVPAKDNRDVQVACLGLGPVVGSTDWDRIVTSAGAIDADVARKYVGPWRIVVTYTDPDTGQNLRFVREYPVIWLWPERE